MSIQSAPSRYCVHGHRRALCPQCHPPVAQAATCQCGHLDASHFDEVGACSRCWCEHFLRPGARLRDVLIPAGEGQTRGQ